MRLNKKKLADLVEAARYRQGYGSDLEGIANAYRYDHPVPWGGDTLFYPYPSWITGLPERSRQFDDNVSHMPFSDRPGAYRADFFGANSGPENYMRELVALGAPDNKDIAVHNYMMMKDRAMQAFANAFADEAEGSGNLYGSGSGKVREATFSSATRKAPERRKPEVRPSRPGSRY